MPQSKDVMAYLTIPLVGLVRSLKLGVLSQPLGLFSLAQRFCRRNHWRRRGRLWWDRGGCLRFTLHVSVELIPQLSRLNLPALRLNAHSLIEFTRKVKDLLDLI